MSVNGPKPTSFRQEGDVCFQEGQRTWRVLAVTSESDPKADILPSLTWDGRIGFSSDTSDRGLSVARHAAG